jgi:hypothetical protein
MNIRDAKTYNLYGTLKLALLVEEGPPERSEMQYEHEGDYWYAEAEGYVDYFVDGGSGGISRTVTTVDGEERKFRKVGASRASIFNREGIGPFVDVKITTDEEEFKQGPTKMSEATVTLKVAKEAARLIGVKLIQETNFDGEVKWVPSSSDE